MLAIEKNPESQLYLLEFLANFKDPKNIRQRLKTTPFKVLQAIYHITKHNLNRNRPDTYPSKEYIAQVAGCGRRQVTDFINSPDCEIFCEVRREYDLVNKRFCANHYVLKDWVFDWFRLFWRSGMMRNFRNRYDYWLADFTKRVKKWLVPLVNLGKSVKEIYEGVVNKLSTKNLLKGAAGKCLKGADTTYTRTNNDYVSLSNRESETLPLPSVKEFTFLANQVLPRFHLKEADINSVMKSFSLNDIKSGIRIHEHRVKNGFKPNSPVAGIISAITEHRKRQ